ncbi:putative Transcription termination factor 3, mitochondrial [Hypsibius exemplaris]|uniref:Transcription termination factor 3, mitochondrial n=1 Tax=Hypsibius exemplaris TaxID=2072580 RepID=A0A1W0X7Z4_HYPEX|nr:putative Transcription termination factor 3, mitochondrial [Hypsibius exemplaris]
MASARLMRSFALLENFISCRNRIPICITCARRNLSSRTFSHFPLISRSRTTLMPQAAARFSSTKPAEKSEHNEENSASSSRSAKSSNHGKGVPYSVVDAENDMDYFKEVTRQTSYSDSAKNRVNWNQFVDPDQPDPRDELKLRSSEDRFGPTTNPLMSSDKPRTGKAIRIQIEKDSTHQFVNPDKPTLEDHDQNLRSPEERSGPSTHPLMYPKKPRTGKAIETQEEIDDVDWKALEKNDPENRPFEPVHESDPELAEVQPALQPFSHNLAAYANVNENVQKFVDMGVEVWKLDKDPEMSQRLMTAEWDVKIQPWIDWLKENALTNYDISVVLSKHPRILKVSISDLQSVADYFASKKFPKDAIGQIIARTPQVFSWSAKYIDRRLGALQKKFKLNGDEMRSIIIGQPKLVVLPSHHWDIIRLALTNELGFTVAEVKTLLLQRPKIFRQEKTSIIDRFDYLHNVCHFPHAAIVQFPGALVVRKHVVKERHLFLKSIRRNQYDPTRPGYVSLEALVSGRDVEFCTEVAKTPVEVFNEFTKTL